MCKDVVHLQWPSKCRGCCVIMAETCMHQPTGSIDTSYKLPIQATLHSRCKQATCLSRVCMQRVNLGMRVGVPMQAMSPL